jgi:hypothetical protein
LPSLHPFTCAVCLLVHFDTYVGTYNRAERAAVAVLFILEHAVAITRPVEILGHNEDRSRAGGNAELAPLAALIVDFHLFHRNLLNCATTVNVRRLQSPVHSKRIRISARTCCITGGKYNSEF